MVANPAEPNPQRLNSAGLRPCGRSKQDKLKRCPRKDDRQHLEATSFCRFRREAMMFFLCQKDQGI